MPNWLTETFLPGVLAARQLNQIRDNFLLLENHRHSGASGEGAGVLSSSSSTALADQIIIYPRFPKSSTGASYPTLSFNNPFVFNLGLTSQNDQFVFPVGMQAGTWKLTFIGWLKSNFGIGTFYLDATSIGTIDFYSAGLLKSQKKQITGISVASGGWYDLKMKMETKNGSSSGYASETGMIELLRTA